MTEVDFYKMTPRSFANLMTGYSRKQEAEFKDKWEQTRVIVATSLMPHLKGKKSIDKIWPLPWDNETTKIKGNPKDLLQKKIDRWSEIDNKTSVAKAE
jgi:hypothetical protein